MTEHQTWKFWLNFLLEVHPQRHRHIPCQIEYASNHWLLVPVLVRWPPAVHWLPPKLLGQWPLGGRWSPALQPYRLPPFLSSAGLLMSCVCLLTAQLQFAWACRKESQQQEMACKLKNTHKAQRRRGHCSELLFQRSLKRRSRERPASRQASRMLLCHSALSLTWVCVHAISGNSGS